MSLFPIADNEVWQLFKLAQSSYWTSEEIDLSLDDFESLKLPEKNFVKMVLCFFNSADILVNKNLCANFISESFADTPEIQAFYWLQGFMEVIHSETYSILIDTYFTNKKEKADAFNAIKTVPSIREKALWVTKYMNRERPTHVRLAGFALVEGLQFSGSFCAIFWLKKRNLCPGLGFSNNLISRDEGLHTKFSCLMFKRENAKLDVKDRLSQEDAHLMVSECVAIEDKFVCDSLKVSLIGMNANLMSQYIRFVADVILQLLGFEKLYNVSNPFEWMESISLEGKMNFFEGRVAEYQKANVGQSTSEREFKLNCDF